MFLSFFFFLERSELMEDLLVYRTNLSRRRCL